MTPCFGCGIINISTDTESDRQMTNIMTPDEFIIRAVNAYPSLYAAPSYDAVKFKVLDHIFNTIGNGLYMEHFEGEPCTEEEIAAAQKWFTCKRAAHGYMKTRKLGGDDIEWVVPVGDPEVTVPVYEMVNHPEIVHWVEFDCVGKFAPYPNFKKQYSMVWDDRRINFAMLGNEWAQAAIWFYNQCRDYFMDDDRVKPYHSAFPKASKRETTNTISDYKKSIGDTTKYPTNDDISKAYACEFIGDRTSDDDVAAFITRRWNAERQRILNFIDETIELCGVSKTQF